MDADVYQELASHTAGNHDMITYTALGLTGEAGEVANKTKKFLFHDHPYDRALFLEELGDVQWYLAMCAKAHNITLNELMTFNIAKLKKRYPEGFTSERSINREK
jgi:NTP pyrophosphatase (non-canonical NTP hydrolase)